MIYLDDEVIKVGGIVLPGLLKNLEVKTDAQVEEQDIEGSSAKPKQATGYEDAKITIDLILDDSPEKTKEDKLQMIQNLFRQSNQALPIVHEIVNLHMALRGISRVIFKNLTTKETNKKSEITASIELWEYVPITITATKSSTKKSSKSSSSDLNLTENYKNYLSNDKGKAPTVSNKVAASPAIDNASGADVKTELRNALGGLTWRG